MKKVVFLPYDYDTAIGTNNEGALVFGYNLEDIDKLPGGADVYNGQQSVLWNNIRNAFGDELMAMYQNLRSTGALSYDKVEQMFEDHQSKWPESIFNEDSYFKYLEPLINDGSSVYLSMLQGSKAEQRKWWLYNRFRYIDSKYNAGDALTDFIQLRGYSKANITVTPYADIYPSIKYGSYLVQKRGTRNVATTLECPLDNLNDTEIYIYSASQLASIGDVSGLKVGLLDLSKATRIQSIKCGDGASSYTNPNLTEVTFGNNTLLRSVDVRNCPNLTQAVDLSTCPNIEEIYFDGTAVTSVSVPNGGVLKKLHLPSTVTNLTVRNQPQLTEFVMPSYSNITTLRVENSGSAINAYELLKQLPANSRVRIIGMDLTMTSTSDIEAFYDKLDTMRGLDEYGNNTDKPQVKGTITGLNSATGTWLAEMQARYPDITIHAEHITAYLYYYNFDGSSLLYTETIKDGGDGTYNGTPTRPATAANTYTFVGWSRYTDQYMADATATKNVTTDRKVYAAYTAVGRTYTVTFYNGSTMVQKVTGVPYGGSASYTGGALTYTGDEPDKYEFIGWIPEPKNIQGDTKCEAVYKYTGYFYTKILDGSISGHYENDNVTKIGEYAFSGTKKVTSFSFPNAVSVGRSAFESSSAKSISLEKAQFINGDYAFQRCENLKSVNFPSVQYIGNACFYFCPELGPKMVFEKTVTFKSAYGQYSSAFINCASLKTVDFKDGFLSDESGNYTYIFFGCGNLSSIIIRGSKIPSLKNRDFYYMASAELYIYVPSALLEDYKAATNWSTYADQIRAIEDYPEVTGGA